MEEPGRLQSTGSLIVGHDWATSLSLFTFMHWRRKWQPTPVFLPGESQGWGSLVGCLPSMGSHRVGHDRSDLPAVAAAWLSNVPLLSNWATKYSIVYMYHSFLIHSSVDGHLGCFHVPASVNSAAMNIGVHESFWIVVFSGYMPSSGIAGSYGGFIPSFF